MCSTSFRISTLYEYIENDLEYVITEKINYKMPFSEEELLIILDSIVDALSFLQRHNISHGDLKPGTILVTKEEEYKL